MIVGRVHSANLLESFRVGERAVTIDHLSRECTDAWASVTIHARDDTVIYWPDGGQTMLRALHTSRSDMADTVGMLAESGETTVTIYATRRQPEGVSVDRIMFAAVSDSAGGARFSPRLSYARSAVQGWGEITGAVYSVHRDGDLVRFVLVSDVRSDRTGLRYREAIQLFADAETPPFDGYRLTDHESMARDEVWSKWGDVVARFERESDGRLHIRHVRAVNGSAGP